MADLTHGELLERALRLGFTFTRGGACRAYPDGIIVVAGPGDYAHAVSAQVVGREIARRYESFAAYVQLAMGFGDRLGSTTETP